jgi:hypothetical protein
MPTKKIILIILIDLHGIMQINKKIWHMILNIFSSSLSSFKFLTNWIIYIALKISYISYSYWVILVWIETLKKVKNVVFLIFWKTKIFDSCIIFWVKTISHSKNGRVNIRCDAWCICGRGKKRRHDSWK